MTGTVKWFNDAKGFGYIDYQGVDVFVHYSSIVNERFKTLSEGQQVEFELNDLLRPIAKNVRKINKELQSPFVDWEKGLVV